MKVLTRLAKLPRMNRDGIIFDPKSLKPILFAAYPLLVPLCASTFHPSALEFEPDSL